MNVANALTIGRLFLTVGFLYYILVGGYKATIMATVLFALAGVSDFFDGYFARKYNLVSDFGKMMDPIADKFLVIAAFGAFSYMGLINVFITLIIAAREIAVTVSRFLLIKRGKVIPADKAGKIKTVFQMTAIIIILLMLCIKNSPDPSLVLNYLKFWWYSVNVTVALAMISTVASGFMYFESVNK